MSERNNEELLEEFTRRMQKGDRHRKIIAYCEVIMLIMIAAIFIILVPKLLEVISAANECIARWNGMMDQLEPMIDDLNTLDIEGISQSMNELSNAINSLTTIFH